LHANLSSAHLYTHAAESHLDACFTSLTLASHSAAPTPTSLSHRHLTPTPAYLDLPATTKLGQPRSPHGLIRALARADVERPPTQMSDTVHKAVQDHEDVMQTPRKPPVTLRQEWATPVWERTLGRH
jgi:hypothetical protein